MTRDGGCGDRGSGDGERLSAVPNPAPTLGDGTDSERVSQLPVSSALALRQLVEEMRDETPTELSWDAVQAGMWARIDGDEAHVGADWAIASPDAPPETDAPETEALPETEAPETEAPETEAPAETALDLPTRKLRSVGPPSPKIWWIAAAAAVLLAVVGAQYWLPGVTTGEVSSQGVADESEVTVGGEPKAESDPQAVASETRDLHTLGEGDVVEALGAPMTFASQDDLEWTLSEGGRLVVDAAVDRPGHVVRLERGTIRAEVTHRSPAERAARNESVERFVVEVEDKRVSVRGTIFTVSRIGSEVVVDVERGKVAVGELADSGLTEGRLLIAPAHASFALQGKTTARHMPRKATGGAALSERPSSDPKKVPAPAASPEAASPKPTLTVGGIRSGLNRCLDQAYSSWDPGLKVSVSTVFHVSVDETGAVSSARFVPPMKSELAICAGGLVAGRFEEGPQQLQIPVSFSK